MADQTATLGSEYVELLSAEQRAATGFTHRFVIPYTEVYSATQTTQGDTKTLTLGTTPTRFMITRVAGRIKTAYATTGTLTVAFGTSADPDNYINEVSAKTAAVITGLSGGDPETLAGSHGVASVTLVAQFATQASTGAISDITAGELEIYAHIVNLDDLS
jgi:hypothetical protein